METDRFDAVYLGFIHVHAPSISALAVAHLLDIMEISTRIGVSEHKVTCLSSSMTTRLPIGPCATSRLFIACLLQHAFCHTLLTFH